MEAIDIGKGFNYNRYVELLETDQTSFIKYISIFSQRNLTITKAEIGIERQQLFKWKKLGLLPYRTKIDSGSKFWNKYSFIELCWLRVLYTLRQQGVGIEKLKSIKEHLFSASFLNEILSIIDVEQLKEITPNFVENARASGLIIKNKFQPIPVDNEFFEDTQFSPFSSLLLSTMLLKQTQVLYIDENVKIGVINLDDVSKQPLAGIKELLDILSSPSIVTVNIAKVISYILINHKQFSKALESLYK
jgi:DNA-binding transcriptional MerR regulator